MELIKGIPGSKLADIEGFSEVISRYPFFYAGWVLEARRLKQNESLNLEESIRRASLLSPNRALLKSFVDGNVDQTAPNKEPKKVTPNETIGDRKDAPHVIPFEINTEPAVLEQIASYPELVTAETASDNRPKSSLHLVESKMPFAKWLKQISGADKQQTQIESQAIEDRDREALIRKFIETEPQISKPQKASFYSAAEMARKSTEDRDDIVSETLAGIYAQQGDIARAMRVYQKLCLLYPEKSSYFAALIKNLTTTT